MGPLWVVIYTRDRHDALAEQLRRVRREAEALARRPVRVVVCDDGSDPPVRLSDNDGVSLIRSNSSRGPSLTRDAAIRFTPADALILEIDDRDWIEPGALRLVGRAFGCGAGLVVGDCLVKDKHFVAPEGVLRKGRYWPFRLRVDKCFHWGLRAYSSSLYDRVTSRWDGASELDARGLFLRMETVLGGKRIASIPRPLCCTIPCEEAPVVGHGPAPGGSGVAEKRSHAIIVSMPRSGLNWVRYCIEHFSGRRTPGYTRLISGGAPIVHRTHDVCANWGVESPRCRFFGDVGEPLYSRMIFLLRNYKESYVRAAGKDMRRMDAYVSNLRAYDDFRGEKILVYYEDLVKDFLEIVRLLRFLGVTPELDVFDVEEHRRRSIRLYEKQYKCYTKCDPLDFTYHSSKLSARRRLELDRYMRSRCPDLYDVYLSRYSEECLSGSCRPGRTGPGEPEPKAGPTSAESQVRTNQ